MSILEPHQYFISKLYIFTRQKLAFSQRFKSKTELKIVCLVLCLTLFSAYQVKRFLTQVLVHPLQTQLIVLQIIKFPDCLASFQAFTPGHFTNAPLICKELITSNLIQPL